MVNFNDSEIPVEKFSDIEVFKNGIKIELKLGKISDDVYKITNVYLSNEDITKMIDTYSSSRNETINSDEEYNDEISDAVY